MQVLIISLISLCVGIVLILNRCNLANMIMVFAAMSMAIYYDKNLRKRVVESVIFIGCQFVLLSILLPLFKYGS